MSRISLARCVVAIAAALAASSVARAETTTWDAYADFHSDHNQSTDTWQYIYQEENADLIRGNFSSYGPGPEGYDVWGNVLTTYHFIGKNSSIDSTGLVVHPNNQPPDTHTWASVIGWKSPINGTVNVSFAVTDLSTGSEYPSDGVSYKLYRAGSATNLTSGTIDDGGATGPISLNSLTVAQGDMLCVEIGARNTMYYDLTGVAFTVTAVPEPGTLALSVTSFVGLLCYAWRKRK